MVGHLLKVDESELTNFSRQVLTVVGATESTAEIVTESLLYSDRRGVHTHGLARLPSYVQQVSDGVIDPRSSPEVGVRRGALTVVEGRSGFGAVAGLVAADEAVRQSHSSGIGLCWVRDAGHFGAAAYYSERIALQGCLGIVATNTPGVMAPHGGREPILGNNPLAFAAPGPANTVFLLLDMAQSMGARGKIKLAEMCGRDIPVGWAIDTEGRPTTDPAQGLEGALLPAAGHKGSGLALMIEILTAAVAGGTLSFDLVNTGLTARQQDLALENDARRKGVTSIYIAIQPTWILSEEEYFGAVRALIERVRNSTPGPGFERVLVPGDLERAALMNTISKGIQLEESTIQELVRLGTQMRIPYPPSLLASGAAAE
ncbi:MAG TPA: Ldh family oxidoreductase [Thermomicrobiaceae bacterium]|nr:Ldh family oxidoreductase [Thermomicrobiaceae bacterium]